MVRIKLLVITLAAILITCCSSAVVLASSTSTGNSWTVETSGTANDLMCVTYGNDRFVAVGNNGTILTSSDGTTWTQQPLPYSPPSLNTVMLSGVAYGGNIFVAVGDKTILTSSDGVNWTPINYVTYSGNSSYYIQSWLTSVTYCNNTFVVLGKSGTIITSSDGVNWTQQDVNSSNQVNGVAAGNNNLVAVGNSGTVLEKELPIPIQSVQASNGTVTVVLTSVPSATPTIGEFLVQQSINDGTAISIQPTALSVTGNTIKLTVPLVQATSYNQIVVDSVSFNGGSSVTTQSFTVYKSTSSSLLPSIPTGSIVFSNGQAMSFVYANNSSHQAEVKQDLLSSSKVYVINYNGSIIDNITGNVLSSTQIAALIPAVTYKDSEGNILRFSSGDGPQIGTTTTDNVIATVVTTSSGSSVTVTLQNPSALTNAAKYQVFQSDGLTSISSVTTLGQASTVYPAVQIGNSVVIKFYQADGSTSVGTPKTVTLTTST